MKLLPEISVVICSYNRADYIDVEYDFTYGYPTNVYIDYDRRVADEELSLTTRGLREWN